jgi:hypothetical protein
MDDASVGSDSLGFQTVLQAVGKMLFGGIKQRGGSYLKMGL